MWLFVKGIIKEQKYKFAAILPLVIVVHFGS